MDEKNMEKNEEVVEIDLKRLLSALLNKAWLIAAVAIVCAVITFLGTFFMIAPKYQSSTMFYVNNTSVDLGSLSMSITAADISAARGLAEVYIIILETRETINDVIDHSGLDLTYGQVKGMISAAPVNETEIFRVVVTSEDPHVAKAIADSIAVVLPKRINGLIDGTSAKVVDRAVLAGGPSSPSYTRNTMLGFILGLMATAAVIVVLDLLNTSIRTEDDITRSCNYPILAAVPDMQAPSKGGYGYGKKKGAYDKDTEEKTATIGGDISFSASEAYKLLRTKLQFSFSDEKTSHVIGISSALVGEGKSLTAVNLAHTLSQLGKRVILIDCDMRRPTVAGKLPVKSTPGLSDFLSGQSNTEKLIQLCNIPGDERAFHVISAGRIPPNPMELLSSARMEKMLKLLSESYEYILLDLPPVGEVGDAMAVTGLTDGLLVVVRQNYSDRHALSAAIRQFQFVNAKILGVVFNCTTEEGGKDYYHKKYYSKYSRRYYRTYNTSPYEPKAEQE